MRAEIVKWLSIAALLPAVAFWKSAPVYRLPLHLVFSMAAACIAALHFNPAMPLFRSSGRLSLAMAALAIAPFALSLIAPKPQSLLSDSPDHGQEFERIAMNVALLP